jgi:hypothetical protein
MSRLQNLHHKAKFRGRFQAKLGSACPSPRGRTFACQSRCSSEVQSGKGTTVTSDINIELNLWNKNVDSLIRVLQRLDALGILSGQTLKDYEIPLEELRSGLNMRILEIMLTREQTDHWRFSRQREAQEDAGRIGLVE